MFPKVTGIKFLTRKPATVKLPSIIDCPAIPWAAARTSSCPFNANPIGMKYMFATLCSKPDATNAVIGKITARILSIVLRPLKASQIARQTRTLQRMPLKNASRKGIFTLALAISRALPPTMAS